MRREILITGANGEIGHGLINRLAEEGTYDLVAIDLSSLDASLRGKCSSVYQGNVLDSDLLCAIEQKHNFEQIYHLASILSTGGEKNPTNTHNVNVNGAFDILNLAQRQSEWNDRSVVVIFPSSIAAYGLPNVMKKNAIGAIDEPQHLQPITMYGVNKIYVEHLGCYYSEHYKLLEKAPNKVHIDFRSLRLPGLISAETLPTGGTSDFFPEMLHSAARREAYECFVRPDTKIPFMVIDDAVSALMQVAQPEATQLNQRVYNVTSFALSAEEIRTEICKYFPDSDITFKPDEQRQKIVDSWPADVDDSQARKDWGWKPMFDKDAAFDEYLVPRICARYGISRKKCVNM